MNATLTPIKTTITVISRQSRIRCTAKVDLPEYGLKAGQRFHLVRVSGTTYKVQAIEIVSSHLFADGSVTCDIRTNEGKEYITTLNRGKPHACNCASTVECFHIDCLRAAVNAQIVAHRKAAKSTPVIAAPVLTNAERGSLNGQKPFSLLKVA